METFTQLFGDLLAFVYHCFDRIVIYGYLSGLETVRRARARHPDLKALFIWGIEPIPNRRHPDREDFVSKPFSGHELLGCVFELLLRHRNDRERIVNAPGVDRRGQEFSSRR